MVHLYVATGGAFLSLTIDGATTLVNKMVSNQSWGEERKSQKSMHTVKETDMLSAKIDLLMKRLDERAQDKEALMGTVQAMDPHMMCEVCENVGHCGMIAPKIHEEATFINSGFRQPSNNGWNNQSRPQGNSNFNSNYNSNQPSFKDLVLGQVKINENITKKLMYNDKMLENINSKIESLSSSVKNQLSFNKMIETQISQIAVAIPIDHSGKSPGQPENSFENGNAAVDQ